MVLRIMLMIAQSGNRSIISSAGPYLADNLTHSFLETFRTFGKYCDGNSQNDS